MTDEGGVILPKTGITGRLCVLQVLLFCILTFAHNRVFDCHSVGSGDEGGLPECSEGLNLEPYIYARHMLLRKSLVLPIGPI